MAIGPFVQGGGHWTPSATWKSIYVNLPKNLEVGQSIGLYLLVRLNCPLDDPSDKKNVKQPWPN